MKQKRERKNEYKSMYVYFLHKFPNERHAIPWCYCRHSVVIISRFQLAYGLQCALYHRSQVVWICINIISFGGNSFALLACHRVCIVLTSKFCTRENQMREKWQKNANKNGHKDRVAAWRAHKNVNKIFRIKLSSVHTANDDNSLLVLCSV